MQGPIIDFDSDLLPALCRDQKDTVMNNPVISHMRSIRCHDPLLPAYPLASQYPSPAKVPLITFHFTTNGEANRRQIGKDTFLHSCCGSPVSSWSNNIWSADNCFCHCNQRRAPRSRNYKCREMEGKSILFKSVLVSANTLRCH